MGLNRINFAFFRAARRLGKQAHRIGKKNWTVFDIFLKIFDVLEGFLDTDAILLSYLCILAQTSIFESAFNASFSTPPNIAHTCFSISST